MTLMMLDLDNTLADRQAAFDYWLDRFVSEHSDAARHRAWIVDQDADGHRPREAFLRAVHDRFGVAETIDTMLARYRRLTTAGFPQLHSDVLDRLDQLRVAGDTLAVVTNGDANAQAATCRKVGLRNHIDALVISGAVNARKPDRSIFEIAAREARASLRGSWMIGDAEVDVEGGLASGARTVWLRRSRRWRRSDLRPDDIVDTIEEALDLRLNTLL